MIKFSDYDAVIKQLEKSQAAEKEQREYARNAEEFVTDPDGQWEDRVKEKFSGRPRYTFDKTSAIVDQIAGEMSEAAFTIKVTSTDAVGSKEDAEIFEGLIRNIINISDADLKVFPHSDRGMIIRGVDGWEITQEYCNDVNFEQDLFIRKIHNYIDRVWFDVGAQQQDMSDARFVFILDSITLEEYEDKFPEGSKKSIGTDSRPISKESSVEFITVARFLYKKPTRTTLVRMTDGSIYEENEDYKQIADELALQGIIEQDRRVTEVHRVHQRILDGGGWLNKEEKTVFDGLPIIPEYADFMVTNNEVKYRSPVSRVMDQQRVYNYARSRQIEEVALAPRAKYWMTAKQAKGYTDTLKSLNTNSDPVQLYNVDDQAPNPPVQNGGAQVNQGLEVAAASAERDISHSANMFAAQMGDNAGLQSGVAISQQINQGNIASNKFFTSKRVAMAATAKVLIRAIPRVYDSTRQVRLLNEDGSADMVTLNRPHVDEQTGQTIALNDLSKGMYEVACDIGQQYDNKRQEGTDALVALAQIDPSIIQIAKDQLIKNVGFIGSDEVGERARAQMIAQGLIPQEQLTDEELAAIQQQQQSQQQGDPAMMLAAQAEMEKAQAQQQEAGNKTAALQIDAQKVQLEVEKFQAELDGKLGVEGAKLEQEQQRIALQAEKDRLELSLKLTELEQKYQSQLEGEVMANMLYFDPETGVLGDKQ